MTKETAADSVIQGKGDPLYRYTDLLLRRKLAAMAGQHRVVQRYTKQIAIFRAAFDMPQVNDEPKPLDNYMMGRPASDNVGETMVGDDTYEADLASVKIAPNAADIRARLAAVANQESEPIVSQFDSTWMRQQTTRGLAAVVDAAKPSVMTRKRNGPLTTYSIVAKARIEIDVVDGGWCCGARIDGVPFKDFEFRPEQEIAEMKCIPAALEADDWQGSLPAADAQKYCVAWVKLAAAVKES